MNTLDALDALDAPFDTPATVVIALYDARELVRIWGTIHPTLNLSTVTDTLQAGIDAVHRRSHNTDWFLQNSADRARETGEQEALHLAHQLECLYRLVRSR